MTRMAPEPGAPSVTLYGTVAPITATFMPGLIGRVWLSFFSSTMLSIAAFSARARWASSQTIRLFT